MKNKGFTLVELIVTIAIIGIIAAVAIPNLVDTVKNNRLSTTTNDFIGALALARSEAIKRRVPISVQSVSGTVNWEGGWQIRNERAADPVIREFPAAGGNMALTNNENKIFIRFNRRGMLDQVETLTFNACDDRDAETGRQITVDFSGRHKLDRHFAGCNPTTP